MRQHFSALASQIIALTLTFMSLKSADHPLGRDSSGTLQAAVTRLNEAKDRM